jgi:hypothetical protein
MMVHHDPHIVSVTQLVHIVDHIVDRSQSMSYFPNDTIRLSYYVTAA